MIDPGHLLQYVIRPTLGTLAERSGLPLATLAAERLLLATAAHESQCGRFLHQLGGGPARGIYQVEPRTYVDTLARIGRWPGLREAVVAFRGDIGPHQLEGNLLYATAVARAFYWLAPAPLPDADDIDGIGAYAKRFFNTSLGKATAEDYANAYRKAAPGKTVFA